MRVKHIYLPSGESIIATKKTLLQNQMIWKIDSPPSPLKPKPYFDSDPILANIDIFFIFKFMR